MAKRNYGGSWLTLRPKDLERFNRDFRNELNRINRALDAEKLPMCIVCKQHTSSSTYICPCDMLHPICDTCEADETINKDCATLYA